MLSVVSCTMSVLSRLSANMKAPVSTVSSSSVAEWSCSLVDRPLQASWARGCSRLFTVSTMAWGRGASTAGHTSEEGAAKRRGLEAERQIAGWILLFICFLETDILSPRDELASGPGVTPTSPYESRDWLQQNTHDPECRRKRVYIIS